MVHLAGNGKTILFIRTDPGTIEPRIVKQALTLVRAGYEVSVFGWDRRRQYQRAEELNQIKFQRSTIPAPYGSKFLLFVLPLFWLHAFIHVVRARPDVVHACDLDAFIPALVMKPLLRYVLVYDIFDHFAEKISGVPVWVRKIVARFDRFAMSFADAVIVTDENRRNIVNGAMISRVEVIMNVPPAHSLMIQDPGGRRLRLSYAGVIHEHRGLYLLAEAVRDLVDVEVTLAGWIPRTVDREFLKRQHKISFLGKLPYEKSLELLASSDTILALYDPSLPINALASSNKIFEAMSVARPVITNFMTTMAPIVEEEQCGLLIEYGDVDSLRNAIIRLKDNPTLRKKLGGNGYRAFKGKYNWGFMEKRLETLYHDLTHGSVIVEARHE